MITGPTEVHTSAGQYIFLGGGGRSKVGTCSYYESYEYEWSSYFFIWVHSRKQWRWWVVMGKGRIRAEGLEIEEGWRVR
jgi:hypothetical protein